ncbi:FliO/MopB family protein [bacterium]|nr:FliO/MopB family protein [bacterium]
MINFIVYTLAMSGLIFFALFVYKKVMSGGFHSKGSRYLEIEETMSVNPRKSLMVVRAGSERFLIASDIDRTSLISKLESSSHTATKNVQTFKQTVQNIPQNLTDLDDIYPPQKEVHLELIKTNNPDSLRKRSQNNNRLSAMREMAKKINEL